MNALTVRGWAWANGGVGVVVVEQCNRCRFCGVGNSLERTLQSLHFIFSGETLERVVQTQIK